MRRRSFLASAAAIAAAPSLARAASATTIRFTPEADLAVLDPVWTTASQSAQHAALVYDTLFGQDAEYNPQLQMLEGYTVEEDGRRWVMQLRKGLAFHDGERVLARDCVASLRRWMARDPFGQALAAATDDLAATDDRTIVLRLKSRFPVLAALARNSGVPCVIMPERLAKTDPFTQVTDTTGSGPYIYKADERIAGARVVYARNPRYVPRKDGPLGGTAGPKVAHFERVEWAILPDPTTASAALQRGEIDWLLTPNADLVDSLRKSPGVTVRVAFPLGSVSCLRFNWLQPPFDRAEIRRAVLPAIIQADYMTAMNGEDRTRWRDNVGFFCPGMPMANDAGLEALTGPRSLEAARRNLAAAGYKGERVVLLAPGDVPYAKILAEVTADLLKRTGFNVDLQAMDWGTLVQRRAKQDPLDKGGWSVFHTNWTGADQGTPATHVFLRGNGRAAAPGWPDIPRMEQLRDAWLGAADPGTQLGIAREMQALAFQEIPYIPLGQMISATAHRSDLVGMVPNQVAFWNVRRA